tara:strand:- start:23 stop:754 length:732 start_codon:yes stop_codon:yes gene_type:complete
MDKEKAIKELLDDKNYYGDFGRKYLSNSDIIYLLKNPTQFRVPTEISKPLIEGGYFHTCMLEPEKKDNFEIIDCASRSTKIYKEALGDREMLLLKKEADYIDSLVAKMKGNMEMYDYIYQDGNQYEVPMVDKIMGNWWKSKADIIHKDYIIDLKTTSDLDKFQYSGRTYNYDSQAYIYQRMFGKPMLFFVICKSTTRLGIFDCSPEFLKSGQDKVERATEVYNKFFSDESTEDIYTYIHRQTL